MLVIRQILMEDCNLTDKLVERDVRLGKEDVGFIFSFLTKEELTLKQIFISLLQRNKYYCVIGKREILNIKIGI